MNETAITLTTDLSFPLRKTRQKTIKRKHYQQFLQKYAETGNFTLAAESTGFTREAYYRQLRENPLFKQQFERVEHAFLDQAEQCLYTVALQPSREGFQDRRLLLQSKRPEIYGNKVEVHNKHTVKIEMSMAEMHQALTGHNVTRQKGNEQELPQDIEFTEVSTD